MWKTVARTIAESVNGYKVVIEKSTVPVLTRRIRKVMLLDWVRAGLFDMASNPEFLREGSAVSDFLLSRSH